MQFNDTSGGNGLVQDCEFWTNVGDTGISGDASLLKTFTRLMNIRYAMALALMQLQTGSDGAEDRNYASEQFSTFSITSGQSRYEFLTDGAGNTIQDVTGVQIIPSGSNDYTPLDRLSLSDSDAQLVMSPNTSNAGTPTGYIEKGAVIYFNVIPNFGSIGKLFYRLVPSYVAVSDSTKAPGFIDAGHRYLSLGASKDYVSVHKPDNQVLITRIEAELAKVEAILTNYARQSNPTRIRMTGAVHSSR